MQARVRFYGALPSPAGLWRNRSMSFKTVRNHTRVRQRTLNQSALRANTSLAETHDAVELWNASGEGGKCGEGEICKGGTCGNRNSPRSVLSYLNRIATSQQCGNSPYVRAVASVQCKLRHGSVSDSRVSAHRLKSKPPHRLRLGTAGTGCHDRICIRIRAHMTEYRVYRHISR